MNSTSKITPTILTATIMEIPVEIGRKMNEK